MLLMPVLFVQAFSSCSLIDESEEAESVATSLAFNVSVNRSATRMSDEKTQQPNTSFRGIQDLVILPFGIQGTIGEDSEPLPGMTYDMHPNETVIKNYFDDRNVKIPFGTASFLCYARAAKTLANETPTPEENFENGSITASGLDAQTPNTSTFSFAPKVIYTTTTTVNETVTPTVHAKATAIANYLTDIAQAIPEENHDFFLQFINNGHPVAASSTNVTKLEAWATTNGITLPTPRPEGLSDYPSVISLPDGAAVVKWNFTEKKFEPQPVTTTEANVNSLNRFVYPAELWYYANSRIKTSTEAQKEKYNQQNWSDVLASYDTDNGVIDYQTKSVAIKDPLSYAVGCLRIGLVVSSTMKDANDQTITLSANSFPLTAVFVSGQHAQAYNFTAKNDNNELIIYDNQMPDNVSMGGAIATHPDEDTPQKYVNTLVFQTKDGENVRFALEFTNNSGVDFMGTNGIVFAGTKFYLIGTIKVLPGIQTDDWKKRAFTKNYTTQGTVRISSLSQAYTYLPDLLDPRLEIGIRLVPNWIQSTPTNVPL